jgi:hypothetical protein
MWFSFLYNSKIVCAKSVIELSSEITSLIGLCLGGIPNAKQLKIFSKLGKDQNLFKNLLSSLKAGKNGLKTANEAYKILLSFLDGPLFSGDC